MLALSPELCGRIVQHSIYRKDLLSLCLTCRAFQREAEIRLYSQMQLSDAHRTILACSTIIGNERLALLVRTFWFTQDEQLTPTNLGRGFWSVIQRALISVSNLEILLLWDNSFVNSWILDTPLIRFRLKEAKLRFTWDAPLVKFLETQEALQTLHFYDALEDITHHVALRSLPSLRTFDGTLMVGVQLIPCPLRYLQLVIDTEAAPALSFLSQFGALRKSLRSLNLLEIPEEFSLRILSVVSGSLPELRHIGMYPYPIAARHEFHRYIMRMHYLQSIELDVSRWILQPMIPSGQRALASELQTFCPSIRSVAFWMGNTRVRWTYSSSGQWQHRMESQQYPQFTHAWCEV